MSLPPARDGFALRCQFCDYRPPRDITVGVLGAHFDTEHDGAHPQMELIVLCPRCDGEMPLERELTPGRKYLHTCSRCRRTRIVTTNP